ncbi:MAG: helix-turn-helix domain-containing protein [Bacteroidales bacterium]
MKNRLQRFLELEQLTPAKLADILGIQRSGLSHILSGRNKPGFDLIQKMLIKFPALNADWLITGRGKIYKESNPSVENKVSPTLFGNSDNIKEIDKSGVISVSADIKDNREGNDETEPLENEIKPEFSVVARKKAILKKVILIYSDNTFTEYTPAESN